MSARIDAMVPGGLAVGYGEWDPVGKPAASSVGYGFADVLKQGLTRWIDVETYKATGGNMAPGGVKVQPAPVQPLGAGLPAWAPLAVVGLLAVLLLRK